MSRHSAQILYPAATLIGIAGVPQRYVDQIDLALFQRLTPDPRPESVNRL